MLAAPEAPFVATLTTAEVPWEKAETAENENYKSACNKVHRGKRTTRGNITENTFD